MSMEHLMRKSASRPNGSWSSVAFIVESILLLLFLVASLAVLTQVFSASLSRSVESRTLDAATIAATSIAEHFAADPAGVEEETKLGDLLVRCAVTDEPRAAGTMYRARIEVFDLSAAGGGGAVYSLSTARYEGDGDAGASAAAGAASAPHAAGVSGTAASAGAGAAEPEGADKEGGVS